MVEPQAGDVIIHRHTPSSSVFVAGIVGGDLQLSWRTYAEAVKQVGAFARKTSIDAWYTTDEQTFERIEQHRPTLSSSRLASDAVLTAHK
jgi:hypothetical protein